MKLNYYNIIKIFKEQFIYILIPILITLSYIMLYQFRLDDNTDLFGWYWISRYYERALDPLRLVIGFFASATIAFAVSSIQIRFRNSHYLLVIFGLSLFIIIPFWMVPEINPDMTRFFTQAKYLETHGVTAFIIDWGKDPRILYSQPSPSFIYGILFKFFGENRNVIQAFNTLLFGFGTIATFLLGKRLWNEHVGLYGSLFLMSLPHLIVQVPLMLVDSFSMCTLTIAMLGFLLAIKEFRVHWILMFLIFSIITLSSKLTIPVIFAFAIIAAGLLYASRKKEYIHVILLFGLIAAVLIPIFLFKYELLLIQLNRVINFSPLMGTTWPSPVYPISMFYQLTLPIVIMFLLSPLLALKRRDKRFIILLAWIIPIILISGGTRLRFLIPIYPAIALAAGYTIYELIRDIRLRRYLVGCIMLSSLTIGFSYIPFMQSYADRNLMDAAAYVEEKGFEEIGIVTYYHPEIQHGSLVLHSIFDYYYSGNLKSFSNIEDVFNISKTKELPDVLVIIAMYDFRMSSRANRDEALAVIALENNYDLIKRFDSGIISVWSPMITSIYKRTAK